MLTAAHAGTLTHGSLFAGIGGFDFGFKRAGWETRWQVEIEPFCQAVLATRFPKTERFNDIRECGTHNLAAVECITAGVPCQDVSVAGKRAGLAGERTGLFYEFARILRELRPAWFVFENVPGLLSSNGGRDFAEVLRVLMVECGYGVCWRVLDSQFFGVAQRRRRVFLVGRFGKPCPAEVLFEPEGGAGDIAKGEETRKRTAGCSTRGTDATCYWDGGQLADTLDTSGTAQRMPDKRRFQAVITPVAANLRSADGHHSGGNAGGFRTEPGEHIVIANVGGRTQENANGKQWREGGPSYTLDQTSQHAVAFQLRSDPGGIGQGWNTNFVTADSEQPVQQQRPGAGSGHAHTAGDERAAADADGVRDFAGLPEGLDSARYRALGNAVTVQVAEWIAGRIMRATGEAQR